MSPEDVRVGDVVTYIDNNAYTRSIIKVSAKTIVVDQPKGFKPSTKRVRRENIREVWRWHKRA